MFMYHMMQGKSSILTHPNAIIIVTPRDDLSKWRGGVNCNYYKTLYSLMNIYGVVFKKNK